MFFIEWIIVYKLRLFLTFNSRKLMSAFFSDQVVGKLEALNQLNLNFCHRCTLKHYQLLLEVIVVVIRNKLIEL